ncbi:MAG: hypothetical protein US71_C0006G0008 [Parcubacteria group bacterium GW2011_GWD2_38_12]|nr:MAG: hypothetical protein US06_C0006G0020 [Parcubacteria group bacterium GW2011_GWC2_36_17]KKQ40575.1 MAG: hypothetical protein US56_C0001G0013 [Candidatus Moranbacteria bacterium GW2011_GWF2_37_7]KKQ42991.1 MAG: hypothetical protein US61_C0018G0005 [Parcubacteria group bacterium GW2011_GWE2_37_8]KKQ52026.1 MAG: hypothetical protein US71_C0006G0008 [Parcubacteria group bacterium GW2011_GWD2_38_12]KKQ58281.1 MAG: hypothetical protein US78_C0019G0005 [Parcubacteria group bacterium GW2011_GWD1_
MIRGSYFIFNLYSMKIIEILALIMGFLMPAGYYFQAWRIAKTKLAHDISLPMYAILSLGMPIWMIYGIYINDWPIITSFLLGTIGAWLVLALIFIYRNK